MNSQRDKYHIKLHVIRLYDIIKSINVDEIN